MELRGIEPLTLAPEAPRSPYVLRAVPKAKLPGFGDPVELRGIEPLTSWLQTTRSPS